MTREFGYAGATAIAGLAMLGSTVASATLGEVAALGDCAVDGAIIRYELARNAADLAHVFGEAGDACRDVRVEAMDALNRVDLYWFVPAYALFLLFAGFFLAGGARLPIAIGAGVLAVGAGVLDVFETLALLDGSPEHAPDAAQMTVTYRLATGKFIALVLNALLLAVLALSRKTIARRIVAGLLCLPVFGVAAMYVDLQFISAQTLTFTLAWLGVLVLAMGSLVAGRGDVREGGAAS